MSKLASILQSRTLPNSPQSHNLTVADQSQDSILFDDSLETEPALPFPHYIQDQEAQAPPVNKEATKTGGWAHTEFADDTESETKDCVVELAFNPVKRLFRAVMCGEAMEVQQMLQTLTREPGNRIAVLMGLRDKLTKASTCPLTLQWETGTNSNGKDFVRLNIVSFNDRTSSSGSTRMTIGSDGTTYATFTEQWNSKPLYLSPDEALSKLRSTLQKPVSTTRSQWTAFGGDRLRSSFI